MEIDNQIFSSSFKSSSMIVSFPTPLGPEITKRLPFFTISPCRYYILKEEKLKEKLKL